MYISPNRYIFVRIFSNLILTNVCIFFKKNALSTCISLHNFWSENCTAEFKEVCILKDGCILVCVVKNKADLQRKPLFSLILNTGLHKGEMLFPDSDMVYICSVQNESVWQGCISLLGCDRRVQPLQSASFISM